MYIINTYVYNVFNIQIYIDNKNMVFWQCVIMYSSNLFVHLFVLSFSYTVALKHFIMFAKRYIIHDGSSTLHVIELWRV